MSIQKKDKYTISDVAQMLGVSRSTISRAMNNSPGVGEELRKKVLDFVEEIGYQPNTIARSLSKGRQSIIAPVSYTHLDVYKRQPFIMCSLRLAPCMGRGPSLW